jgi:5-hydroxyisourate hydrolase-like protein (transthyretin family)
MMRALGSVGVGLVVSVHLAAQAPAPLPGSPLPGTTVSGQPPARPQSPSGPQRDNAQPPTGTAKIVGRVVAAGTGVPLRLAQIRIVAAEQRVMKSATTDAEGRYQITELPAGRYSVTVTRNGYVRLSFGQQRPFEPGKPLDLAAGEVADKIDFALPRGGVVSGRITDELGEPLAGVGVRAMRYQYQPDGRRRLLPADGVPYGFMTDDLGQFRVFGLMPGSYVVAASVNPMGAGNVIPMGGGMVTSFGSNDGSDGYTTTYYPGTASEAEAQTIAVNVGQEASAFFSMVPTRLSNVSGVIRTSQGRPAANVGFGVRSMQGAAMNFVFGGQTGPDGTFVMQNIQPGEYVIEVRPNGRPMAVTSASGPPADLEFASVPLTVAGQNISGLVITTGPGATVTGQVIFDKAAPPLPGAATGQAGQPQRVIFAAADFSFGPMQGNAVIDASGHFQITGAGGKGTFRVIGVTSTLKSVMLHGVDITDTPLEIKPGSDIDGVEITLTNVQTSLKGTVRTPSGDTVKDYVLVIFPSNLREGDSPARFVRSVRPDQEGKFETKGLPPADYFAAAVETMEQGEQWDPAFQDRVKPRATRFSLREGQSLALELQLAP